VKSRRNTAVSLINLKETALYFDRVIPLNLSMEFLWDIAQMKQADATYEDLDIRGYAANLTALFPDDLKNDSSFRASVTKANVAFHSVMQKAICERYNLEPNYGEMSKEQYDDAELGAFRTLDKFLKKFYLDRGAIDLPEIFVDDSAIDSTDMSATLTSLMLIDARKSPWEQIMELRRDAVACQKLRRLRLFAYDNYEGKEKSYIEDDILNRVADYEKTSKEWGFETKQGAMTMILNSKFLAGALTGSFLSSLFGAPIPAIISLAGGAALELGRATLYLKKRKFLLSKAMDENAVSYISYAQSKLAKSS